LQIKSTALKPTRQIRCQRPSGDRYDGSFMHHRGRSASSTLSAPRQCDCACVAFGGRHSRCWRPPIRTAAGCKTVCSLYIPRRGRTITAVSGNCDPQPRIANHGSVPLKLSLAFDRSLERQCDYPSLIPRMRSISLVRWIPGSGGRRISIGQWARAMRLAPYSPPIAFRETG
jgi:hypothetical protein